MSWTMADTKLALTIAVGILAAPVLAFLIGIWVVLMAWMVGLT